MNSSLPKIGSCFLCLRHARDLDSESPLLKLIVPTVNQSKDVHRGWNLKEAGGKVYI